MLDSLPSKHLQRAVDEFAKLPGVGKKTALRLVLFLLKQPKKEFLHFADTLSLLAKNVQYCQVCKNISDTEVCDICSNPKRDSRLICVVENVKDVLAVENTGQYNGLYHVLGGIISPIDGIGPNDLNIESLVHRIEHEKVSEVIFALSTTMEGDTTNYYIHKKIQHTTVRVSMLARGVSFGDELEYADEITLGRSIVNRVAFG